MRAGQEAAGSVPHPLGWGQDSGPCRLSPDLATQAEAGPPPHLQDGHTWKGPSPTCPWLGMRKMLIEHADSHKDTKTKGTFPLGDNSYPEHSLHSRPGMLLSQGGRSNTTNPAPHAHLLWHGNSIRVLGMGAPSLQFLLERLWASGLHRPVALLKVRKLAHVKAKM